MTNATTSVQADTGALLPPGSWLGMLGGGQLGRMFCHAAQRLGYRVAVLDPGEDSPAGAVADRHIRAAYDARPALDELAALCSAVTTEFENVPADSLRYLAARCRVSPAGDAVAVTQDRIAEKRCIAGLGVPVAPHAIVLRPDDIAAADAALFPGILKLARLGYDGKGQARVSNREQALAAFQGFGGLPCVLEAQLPLACELSLVVARGLDGATTAYPISQNEHRDGILSVAVAPAPAVTDELAAQVRRIGTAIAEGIDYRGVLCIEFFVLTDGSLVVNEMAPRPHNSGHYTMDACVCSQFEQQARIMAGLPLGPTSALQPSVMLNLLGDIWYGAAGNPREPDWASVLALSGASLHLYGKREARHGRKMGHVTCMGATPEAAFETARAAGSALGIVVGEPWACAS